MTALQPPTGQCCWCRQDPQATWTFPAFDTSSDTSLGDLDDVHTISSGWSFSSEELDWQDIASLEHGHASEVTYLAYRQAKRKWRSFAPKSRRFVGRKGKGKGKHKDHNLFFSDTQDVWMASPAAGWQLDGSPWQPEPGQ